MRKILIVDDERAVRYSFERTFQGDYAVITAEGGQEALEKLEREHPDLVLMDIKMPGMYGLEALRRIKARSPGVPVIMMTAFRGSDTAIEAMKEGAYDYITKPFENTELRLLIEKGLESAVLAKSVAHVGGEESDGSVDRIVGRSSAILNVCKIVGLVASSDVHVLITGESGVGKEMVARAIHAHSNRKGRPLMAVNSAALPESLVESELFGYELGAFSGAAKRRIGRFEQCSGGTIFLDEIGDMSLATQAKVLRVLQDFTFERLGGNETLKTDVRVIAATNKDLEDEVKAGRFRSDLYHRLNVVSIRIPPLRERREDVPVLAEYFLRKIRRECGHSIKGISPAALEFLQPYSWPGNVRELENRIRRAAVMAKGTILGKEELAVTSPGAPPELHASIQPVVDAALLSGDLRPYDTVLEAVQRTLVKRALELTGGNQVKASALLGISRVTVRKKIEDYKIN
jgi:two-component system, NtrC family, response regulator AtoC